MRRLASLLIGLGLVALAPAASAQAWRALDVPDSSLVVAMRSLGLTRYENAWNALLVDRLRFARSHPDSARRLDALARRVAAAEGEAMPSRIAPDALGLARRWSAAQRQSRIAAAVAESLGNAARDRRERAEADRHYRDALARYRALGEQRRTAWVLGSMGVAAFLVGDYDAALKVYEQALDARVKLDDPRMVGNTLNVLGSTHLLLGHDREAYDWFLKARATREAIGELGPLGATVNYLGVTAMRLGHADSALVWLERARELLDRGGTVQQRFEVRANHADVLAQTGRPEEALAAIEEARAVLADDPNPFALTQLEHSAGTILLGLGRFTEAAEHFARGAAYADETGNPREALERRLSLGQAHLALGDPARARPPLLEARALADSIGDPDMTARVLNNLAIAADLARDPDEATRLAREALAQAEADGDSLLVYQSATTLAVLANGRNRLPEARAGFERAMAAAAALPGDRAAMARLNLGVIANREQRLDEAERHYRQGLEAFRDVNPEMVWKALLGLGDVAQRRERWDEALAHDRAAATLIDTLRSRQGEESGSISMFSNRLFAYEALIHLLGQLDQRFPGQGHGDEAFLWAERAKARAFLDRLGRAAGERRIEPLGLDAARARLARDEAMLAYSVGDSSTTLWAITARESRRFTLPARGALRQRVESLRRALADPLAADGAAARTAARQLYRTLIEPAEPVVGKAKRLVIVPDGPLALLPFEALLAREAEGEGAVPRGAWLVERWALSVAPSVTALSAIRDPGASADRAGVVAIGNPSFGADSMMTPPLPPLPFTAAEVATLERLARGRVVALTDTAATRERVLALPALHEAGVVHIATHGVADEAEPDRSGLWLAAGADGRPGFLAVRDVRALDLDAELVTLSACETGLGRLERGEGVLGLTRAFLGAGARSVVVSLWKVNDRSSATLMERFYTALLRRGMAREQALAEAKRALLRDPATRSPFHWAPFVMVGAGGRL